MGALTGQWDFESGNLSATRGQPLQFADAATQQATSFGTTASFGIPNIGGVDAKVMKFGSNTLPAGILLPAPTSANGEGSQVNQWTLILDLLYPAEADGKWRALIDTDGGIISADAELFVNPANGLGIAGAYSGTIRPATWHRVAFVVDTSKNELRKYIDGVEVGVQGAGNPAVDGRWALSVGGTATLFADNDGETTGGYVNSLQVYDVALGKAQIAAFGTPTAEGLPTALPAIPSSLDRWIPAGSLALGTTDIGIVLATGDANVVQSSIVLKLDGAAVASPTITSGAGTLTVRKTAPGPFAVGSKHTLEVTYDEVVGGATRSRSFGTEFEVALFLEDFEGVVLGPNVEEGTVGEAVWTKTPPAGWTIDDSGMPGFDQPDYADQNGVTEFSGWTFMNRDWWVQTAGDQRRSEFSLAKGVVAVADPDEWDDSNGGGHYQGLFNSYMKTPTISLAGVPAGVAVLRFDSSWRPEANDDGPPGFPEGNINNQTGVVLASYDGGATVDVIRWESKAGPNFKPDDAFINEAVTVALNNPAGASTVQLSFGLLTAANDWWWAVDNIAIVASVPAPTITQQPVSAARIIGGSVGFGVVATSAQLRYQWKKDDVDIVNATNATYSIPAVTMTDAGSYTVVVSNPSGSVTSSPATLTVLSPPADAGTLTQGLAVYLGFEDNFDDASGNNRKGTAVGAPTFAAGKVGKAVRVTNSRAESNFNFVTLGANDTVPFGQTKDFTVAFWAKAERTAGDPSIVANKNWDSGGNPGWTIGTQGDGRVEWNYVRTGNARKDLDLTSRGNLLNNPDAWAHVVVVWRIDGNAETYVNGELVSTIAIGPATGEPFDPALALNLGQDGTGAYGSGEWDGLLDEVAIWDRALSAEEVVGLFAFGFYGESIFAPAITQDLATLLKLDGNLLDSSSAANHGTAVGNPTFTAGRIGEGAHLRTVRGEAASTFNYITLGSGSEDKFGETKAFTASFWVKMNEWASDPAFLGNKDWGSGGNIGWVIATDGDGRIQWNYRRLNTPESTRRDFDSVGGLVSDRAWHHVAVVFDINGVATTYFDGNEIVTDRGGAAGRKDLTPGTGSLFPANLALNIGQDGTGQYSDSDLFDAVMDDVALWNRALSGREVAVVYTRGLRNQSADGSAGPAPAPTLAYAVANGQLTLTWSGEGFVLQENGNVANAAGWTPVAGAGANSATVPMTGAARYFRLRK